MRIGIFFGGQSREREISFAGGRTVYDNLNKSLFDAVPIFVDSLGNFILLNWEYLYKGTIRDFYPPAHLTPESKHFFQVYQESLILDRDEIEEMASAVGKRVQPSEFNDLFDFAFLALHGPFGEDGNIQGILEWYNIPYSGSGILPSAIGISKTIQKDIMAAYQFACPSKVKVSRTEWIQTLDKSTIYKKVQSQTGFPIVIKAPNQGSSIGVSILSIDDFGQFCQSVDKSLFIKKIDLKVWGKLAYLEKRQQLNVLIDIREGIGMPVYVDEEIIRHPDNLMDYLDNQAAENWDEVILTSLNSEEEVLFESFIKGKEFSCIVVQQENGLPMALPPTEIIKGGTVFDYRSKYLPGMTRKITPIDVSSEQIDLIRQECCRLFDALHCNVYARIDGFITPEGAVFLNDPNTTSGMLPSSFFFHQAAEIGLNPSQFLTYIIRTSLSERIKSGKKNTELRKHLANLDDRISRLHQADGTKVKIAVIMGGFSSERHISVESGRNIFEKLASSAKYSPIPVFLTGSEANHELYILPVNVMLKDNADDIKEKVHGYLNKAPKHPKMEQIISEAKTLTQKYTGGASLQFRPINYDELAQLVDFTFIALHGRPGEDGAVQKELEARFIPYNGSGIPSSQLTINKFETNKLLREKGIKVAGHRLVIVEEWLKQPEYLLSEVEAQFKYPLIVKPADDGCSSAVKKIKNREELQAFIKLIFRKEESLFDPEVTILKLRANEEFPQKTFFVVEELIEKGDAVHFLEITGGLLTRYKPDGNLEYEIFEPSEALASGEVLSLEEKFLAGEGQNITPARFDRDSKKRYSISTQVRQELEKAARILNVEGYARIDAFTRIYADGSVETFIIEVNSLPGMTPATCIFHQTAINGYKPYDFIDAIINFGIERNRKTVQI